MPKIFPKRKKEAGTSIVEVVVSLGLVGGLLILYASAFNVLILTKKMGHENIAYHVANKKIEDIRATSFAALPASSSFTDSTLNSLPSASANFTINNYSTYTGMKEIVVTVSWNDGRARSVVIRTLATTGGINAD